MITAFMGSFLLLCVMILYLLLAFGLPFGELAMGGKHKVLPTQYRIACAISTVLLLLAIVALLQTGGFLSTGLPRNIVKGITYFFTFYLFINTIMNTFSKSKKERLIMTPVSAIIALCFIFTIMNS
jgi:hypothetical protein